MIIHPTVEKALLPLGQEELLTLLADPLVVVEVHPGILHQDPLLPQAG